MTIVSGQTGLNQVTVKDLVTQVRQYVAMSSPTTLSDQQIIDDINFVWQYQIPQENSSFGLVDSLQFWTTEGIDTYSMNVQQIISIQGDGFLVDQVPCPISNSYSKLDFYYSLGTRSNLLVVSEAGGQTSFSFTLGGKVARGYVNYLGVFESQYNINFLDSSGNTLTLLDNGDGNLYYQDPVGTYTPYGTIDYLTNSASFVTPVPAYGPIYVNYDGAGWGKPNWGLFCDNVIILKPIPNQPYRISLLMQFVPNPFTSLTDVLPYPTYSDYIVKSTALRNASRVNDVNQSLFLTDLKEKAMQNIYNVNSKNYSPARRSTPFCHASSYLSNGVFPNPYSFSGSYTR